jgi:hypothetical protein
VLSGEQTAYRRGAQDVRTLYGRGGRLMPFTAPISERIDPLQVYLAVRHDGYWAEGFAILSQSGPASGGRATGILDKAIAAARPGMPHHDLARLIASEIGTSAPHPMIRREFGHSIGLALEEPYRLNETSDTVLESGEVYTVRVGLAENDGSALVSAMIAVGEVGPEVLWKAA